MKVNETISENDFVPPELWGRDHYSTLAYVEARLVEGCYTVSFDPRMRQNRRHFRVLPGRKGQGVPMSPEHGSRLADGTYLPWHDDWCCVQDMLQAGLFEGDPDDWDAGMTLKLSDKGHAAAAALRKHKAEGGSFSNCGPVVLGAIT
jgi:hypothetical protein